MNKYTSFFVSCFFTRYWFLQNLVFYWVLSLRNQIFFLIYWLRFEKLENWFCLQDLFRILLWPERLVSFHLFYFKIIVNSLFSRSLKYSVFIFVYNLFNERIHLFIDICRLYRCIVFTEQWLKNVTIILRFQLNTSWAIRCV